MSRCLALDDCRRRKDTCRRLRKTRRDSLVPKAYENHRWCSNRTPSLYARHYALVCRGKVAAKHQDCLERVDWGVRNIRNGIRRSLGVSKNGMEWALRCNYLVKLLIGSLVPVRVCRWLFLSSGRVVHPQATRRGRVNKLKVACSIFEISHCCRETCSVAAPAVQTEHLRFR